MRLGNVIGPGIMHGIIYDLHMKSNTDSRRLDVLGTGEQKGACLYITDAVEAAIVPANRIEKGHTPVNVISDSCLTASRSAELTSEGFIWLM